MLKRTRRFGYRGGIHLYYERGTRKQMLKIEGRNKEREERAAW